MPMMPYHMEKGAIFSIFEAFANEVNAEPLTAVKMLNALRNPNRGLDDSRFFEDLTLSRESAERGNDLDPAFHE